MRTPATLLLTAAALLPAQASPTDPARVLQPGDLAARQAAAAALRAALAADAGGPLLARLQPAVDLLPPGSAARQRAAALVADRSDAAQLRREAADLLADLTFQPVAEADLPKGVPGFQVLDELELRAYPAYRMVRADMRSGGMGAFWPLFQHIESRAIAMTTPVQVDYAADESRARTMAFLYGSPDLGQTGVDGRVEVVDVPAMTVLSLGSRGYERPHRVSELRARLTAWLAGSTEWVAAGPMRTMVYNSPSVGGDRRYFEVQLPVQRRATPPAAEGASEPR
jgi:hypothetical protein